MNLAEHPTATQGVTTDRYRSVRQLTEQLCAPLKPEDYVPQGAEFASPPKWHLAHTSWFFEEMVLKHTAGYREFHPQFSFLFNSYYQAVGERAVRGQRGLMTRPTVDEVYAYRAHVDAAMQRLIEVGLTDVQQPVVELGLQHEQQHQELLLTDLKYTLSLNPIYPVYAPEGSRLDDRSQGQEWETVPEGIYTVGHDGQGFHFDNERGKHRVFLEPFKVRKGLVTNREYLAFIQDGGYQKPEYWLDEGWAHLQANGLSQPLYWEQRDGVWHQFTLDGLQPLHPEAELGHVSYYEAQAFATWKGARLLTEFEWEAAQDRFTWGTRWEWTQSAYLPYPGFAVAEGALGEYNGKFMINQMVLRGASVATAPEHSRKTYRNFFHPHYAWQYTGIRLAQWL